MLEFLNLRMRSGTLGCGIYEAGDPSKCYCKLFVTDAGRVLPINRRVITEEDLMEVYSWGWKEALGDKSMEYGNDDAPDSQEQPR